MKDLDLLLAKQAIHELNTAYTRAVDRLDYKLLETIWAPDAEVDAGIFKGSAAEYSKVITQTNESLLKSSHMIMNEWFELSDTAGVGESYVLAATLLAAEPGTDSPLTAMLVGGRYLDNYQLTTAGWKISRRVFVLDWTRSQPIDPNSPDTFSDMFPLHGTMSTSDPVYAHWR